MTTHSQNDELPALPNASYAGIFTAEQMHAYAREAIAALTPATVAAEAVAYIESYVDGYGRECRGLVWADHPANTPGRTFTPLYAPVVAGEAVLGSRDDFYSDPVQSIAFALAYELEAAELDRNDYVTVNRAKLEAIAARVLDKAKALAALATDGWQTIETAPDNVDVWVFDPDCMPSQFVATLTERDPSVGGFYWRPAEEIVADVLDYELTPTHWRELPTPPSAAKGGTPHE